jgi:hypothetical protein
MSASDAPPEVQTPGLPTTLGASRRHGQDFRASGSARDDLLEACAPGLESHRISRTGW